MSQVCDCAAQMQVMQNDRAVVDPPDIAEEDVSEAMTAVRGS